MIELNDPIWQTLRFAYGTCSEMPRFLQTLYAGTTVDQRFWNRICSEIEHQSTVYDGSYATFPHLIEIASDAQNPNAERSFDVATFILKTTMEYDGRNIPPISDAFRADFESAVAKGRRLIAGRLDRLSEGFEDELELLWLVSLYRLQPRVAMLMDTFRRPVRCPLCNSDIVDPVNALCPFPYPDIRR